MLRKATVREAGDGPHAVGRTDAPAEVVEGAQGAPVLKASRTRVIKSLCKNGTLTCGVKVAQIFRHRPPSSWSWSFFQTRSLQWGHRSDGRAHASTLGKGVLRVLSAP